MRTKFPSAAILLVFLILTNQAFGQPVINETTQEQTANPQPDNKEIKFVGSFFDVQVPLENYIFIESVVAVFGTRGGPELKTPKEREDYIWEQLLLSYEAFRRGITVSQEEISDEISKMLRADKVEFDWKTNKEAYEKWVKDKTNEPTQLFANQIQHLLQIQKLYEQVMSSFQPAVSEGEARQEFLNENNSLGVEVVQFDEKKDAEEFYRRVKANPKFWQEERNKRPKDFRSTGTVSLEFLINFWKFSKDDVYKMLGIKADSLYPPSPIYKGYGVFKVLDTKPADLSLFPKLSESYYEKVRGRKRYEGLIEWIRDLKKQANIKIYEKEGGENHG